MPSTDLQASKYTLITWLSVPRAPIALFTPELCPTNLNTGLDLGVSLLRLYLSCIWHCSLVSDCYTIVQYQGWRGTPNKVCSLHVSAQTFPHTLGFRWLESQRLSTSPSLRFRSHPAYCAFQNARTSHCGRSWFQVKPSGLYCHSSKDFVYIGTKCCFTRNKVKHITVCKTI